ncbi:UDP-glucose 4-epimerase family protein [Stutzerimonas balearica]|uniref:UDP-glucose 4-epimerase family protein n=1 Tax=Stutzerimonas balearica TaxID=74829 RepID=UPI00190D6210|nr:SDR family oxidoreductase [Stutzerimonas balearica]MBK3748431.1 NAD-dependent epimerase/dehydratase family protein [Stutzerimonas balearica]MBK3826628.1 NAD-dependent epimerase/dehydratase family protein [Stutzerimonas balearica]MBK3856318.1 NAD-dependent epimerase/dehydratase family protein [Stutzerimonas balearica]
MDVLVTGANGFVGRALLLRLAELEHFRPIAAVRTLPISESRLSNSASIGEAVRYVELGDLANVAFEPALFDDVSAVVHCAARVHVMHGAGKDSLTAFRLVNVGGTLNLAKLAASAGVKRFVFISTIKVNGEATVSREPFQADDLPAPEDAYGLSKLEAEQGLKRLAAETGMEVVIIRPPLVYGRGVRGNFGSMIKLVEKEIPLPFGAIHNKRSLVGIDNLVDLIVRCVDHPAAANQVFLAGDGQDLSTPELVRSLAVAMGKRTRLISLPAGVLKFGATLLGKRALADRLLGSLQVDIAKTRELLEWQPRHSVEEGLRRCFVTSSQGGRV